MYSKWSIIMMICNNFRNHEVWYVAWWCLLIFAKLTPEPPEPIPVTSAYRFQNGLKYFGLHINSSEWYNLKNHEVGVSHGGIETFSKIDPRTSVKLVPRHLVTGMDFQTYFSITPAHFGLKTELFSHRKLTFPKMVNSKDPFWFRNNSGTRCPFQQSPTNP